MGGGSYLMAFDAGGGGAHCLLVEIESGRATRAFRPWSHPSARGTSGIGSDLDLPAIWSCLVAAAREAVLRAGASPDAVVGVAATSMRMATIALDGAGAALFAVPNRDARAVGEAFTLAEQHGDALYARTGHWPAPVFTAARLRWLAANDGEVLRRATAVLSLSDWIAYRLCGEIGTDASQAGETLLFDLAAHTWAWDLIDRLALPAQLFPAVRPCGSRLGTLTPQAAEALGLQPGIAVGVGGGDTHCGLLGVGAVEPYQAAVIAGTTVPVGMVLDRARIDPRRRLWTGCHVVPDRWVLESNAGPMGETLAWLASVFFPDAPQPVAQLLAEAGRSDAGAAGIVSTLGADVMNARDLHLPLGSLTLSHLTTAHDPDRRRHVLRAIVEGMACGVRANLEQLTAAADGAAERVAFAGGVSRSAVFVQMVSDVLDRPVAVGATAEASALGAAVCAGVAAGVFPNLIDGARRLSAAARTFAPDAARAALYRDQYATWQLMHAAGAETLTAATPLVLPAVLRDMSRAVEPAAPALRPRILATADLDEDGRAALALLGDGAALLAAVWTASGLAATGMAQLPWTLYAIPYAVILAAGAAVLPRDQLGWRSRSLLGAALAGGFACMGLFLEAPVRSFATAGAVASVFAMLASGCCAPAADGRLTAEADRSTALHGPAWVWRLGATALVGVAMLGLPSMRTSLGLAGYGQRYLPGVEGRDLRAIAQLFPPPTALALRVRGAPRFVTSPAVLRAFDNVVEPLRSEPSVVSAMSVADLVKLVHRAFNDNDPAFATIPDDEGLISRYLTLAYSPGFRRFVDRSLATAAIWIYVGTDDPARLEHILARVRAQLAAQPVPNAAVDLIGGDGARVLLMAAALRTLAVAGGVWAASAMALIALLCGWRAALRATLGGVAAIAVMGGSCAWRGLPLDLVSAPLLFAFGAAASGLATLSERGAATCWRALGLALLVAAVPGLLSGYAGAQLLGSAGLALGIVAGAFPTPWRHAELVPSSARGSHEVAPSPAAGLAPADQCRP